jgi:hypothetical protein
MFTHAKAASYPRTTALVCSLTNLLSEPNLAQLSAEDSGRYSSPKQKLVFTVAGGLSRSSLSRANPNPLELLVGAKADSWLVEGDENQRQVESPIHRDFRCAAMGRDNFRSYCDYSAVSDL